MEQYTPDLFQIAIAQQCLFLLLRCVISNIVLSYFLYSSRSDQLLPFVIPHLASTRLIVISLRSVREISGMQSQSLLPSNERIAIAPRFLVNPFPSSNSKKNVFNQAQTQGSINV